jgi:formylglycine-generating enzyme required for sulfatase activity
MIVASLSKAEAQQECKGTKRWYKGKCRYPDDIAKLKKAEKEASKKEPTDPVDKAACKKAREKGTKEAWEAYLALFPDGVCSGEARKKTGKEEVKGEKGKEEAGKSYIDPITGMEMVFIEGGCYEMGCVKADPDCDEWEKPSHRVCMSDFYLGKTEVTVGEFKKFVDETDYVTEAEQGGGCLVWVGDGWVKQSKASWKNPGYTQVEDQPVVCMSWNDAKAFIDWLSQKMGKTYRLPYEAEWEFAAKSRGKDIIYPWGNSQAICNDAVMKDGGLGCGINSPWRVCSKSNGNTEQGLCDMAGNISEWCGDWYGETYYELSPEENPKGPISGSWRVLRGGSWDNIGKNLRSSHREAAPPAVWEQSWGFRLAHDAK